MYVKVATSILALSAIPCAISMRRAALSERILFRPAASIASSSSTFVSVILNLSGLPSRIAMTLSIKPMLSSAKTSVPRLFSFLAAFLISETRLSAPRLPIIAL